MPNWCMNELLVTGPNSKLTEFLTKASKSEDKPLCLEKLYPEPPDVETLKSESEGCFVLKTAAALAPDNEIDWERDGWYYWRQANWGTKWDTDGDTVVRSSEETAVYSFQTAWGPPIEAFMKVSKDFPDLEFVLDYWEPGNCFAGMTHLCDGKSKRIVELENLSRETLVDGNGEYQNPGLSEGFFEMLIEWYEENAAYEEEARLEYCISKFKEELDKSGFETTDNLESNKHLLAATKLLLDYMRSVDEVFLEHTKDTTIHTLTNSLANVLKAGDDV